MAASALDIELNKYWQRMTPSQKRALLDMIKAFMYSPDRTSHESYNQELLEAEAEYEAGNYISLDAMLMQIRHWQNEQ